MRDNAVTYSKAIAIMLMVCGHACVHSNLKQCINMFHVPLFYFMSGYCFKDKYLSNIRQFVIAKIRGLYWPFVKWGCFFILIHNLLYKIGVYNSAFGVEGYTSFEYTIRYEALQLVSVIAKMSCSEPLLGGYWFLKCLFLGSLIFWIIAKINHYFNLRYTYITTLILLILSVLFNYSNIKLYIINYQDLQFAFFIWIGYLYKSNSLKLESRKMYQFLGILLVSIGYFAWPGAAVGVKWQNQIPFMFTAIAGSISVFGLCRNLERINIKYLISVLNFIGNNTLTILTWHFSSFVLVNTMIVYFYSLDSARIAEFPVILSYSMNGWIIVYFIIGIALPSSFAYCNKYIDNSWLKL